MARLFSAPFGIVSAGRDLKLRRRKKRRRLFRVVPAPIVQLRRARVAMPGRFLQVLEHVAKSCGRQHRGAGALLSMIVVVATVVPCTSLAISARSKSSRAVPACTPCDGSTGVLGTLSTMSRPRFSFVKNEVGEGAADIDAEPLHASLRAFRGRQSRV